VSTLKGQPLTHLKQVFKNKGVL